MNKILNSTAYWDNILSSDAYIETFGKSELDRIRQISRNIFGNKVVNVGSGQGYLEKSIDLSKYNWYSVDISLIGLKHIRGNSKIIKLSASIDSLPFISETFDTTICTEVIEHLEKNRISQSLSELNRITLKKGTIIISVPTHEPNTLKYHPVGHLHKFTPETFVNLLLKSGLSIVDVKYTYAFQSYYFLKKAIAHHFSFRRPNVIVAICKKN